MCQRERAMVEWNRQNYCKDSSFATKVRSVNCIVNYTTMLWREATWLVVSHLLLEYKYTDDVTNVFIWFNFESAWIFCKIYDICAKYLYRQCFNSLWTFFLLTVFSLFYRCFPQFFSLVLENNDMVCICDIFTHSDWFILAVVVSQPFFQAFFLFMFVV